MCKRLLTLFGCLALAAGVAAAQDNQPQAPASAPQREPVQAAAGQSITGMLVDATCRAASPSAECEVTAGTTSFGILTSDGRFLKFDANGNTLAKSEMDKSKKTGKVSATVTGSVDGSDTVRVENLSFS